MGHVARWVIGRGLLGSAVSAARRDQPYRVSVDWSSPDAASAGLRDALARFVTGPGDAYEIYWCAGKGVTSTPQALLDAEARVFESFLDEVRDQVPGGVKPLRLFLASSVGGVYAGSAPPPFTESTRPAPLSAYGETKLRMEDSLTRVATDAGFSAFIARITNLYGPGQDLAKGQGLISVIIDSYITGEPVSVYVPLDTLRDYIFVEDCARVVDAGMRRLAHMSAGSTVVKIVGGMHAVSVGAIIGEISRIRRKPVPIILGQGDGSSQAGDLRVRSAVWTDLDDLVSTTLPEGLGAVYQSQLRRHLLPRA